MGIISGYPVGAKIAANFRNNNICSKEECERLLSFTNNSGPLFIIGTVGISMFGSINIGILLFLIHLISSIIVGFCFRFWKYKKTNKKQVIINKKNNLNTSVNSSVSIKNLGDVISQSITSSISTILLIGGYIILFSCIISILKTSGIIKCFIMILTPVFKAMNIDSSFISGLCTGFLEITNGINYISYLNNNISIKLIFTSFLLGFGGISILLQVLSIISKTDLSPKSYILGKILHGLISVLLIFVILTINNNFYILQFF